MSYTALNGLIYLTKFLSGGYIVAHEADMAEYWTCKQHHSPSLASYPFYIYHSLVRIIVAFLNGFYQQTNPTMVASLGSCVPLATGDASGRMRSLERMKMTALVLSKFLREKQPTLNPDRDFPSQIKIRMLVLRMNLLV